MHWKPLAEKKTVKFRQREKHNSSLFPQDCTFQFRKGRWQPEVNLFASWDPFNSRCCHTRRLKVLCSWLVRELQQSNLNKENTPFSQDCDLGMQNPFHLSKAAPAAWPLHQVLTWCPAQKLSNGPKIRPCSAVEARRPEFKLQNSWIAILPRLFPYRANLCHQQLSATKKLFLWLPLASFWTSKSFWVDTTSWDICGATRNLAARTKTKLFPHPSPRMPIIQVSRPGQVVDTTVIFGGTEMLNKRCFLWDWILDTSAVTINAASNISLCCGSQWNMKMYYPNHHLSKLPGYTDASCQFASFSLTFLVSKKKSSGKKSTLTDTSVITVFFPEDPALWNHYICSRHLFPEFASRKKAWSS